MKSDITDVRLRPFSQPSLQRPELLAPAGNWDCAKAAVENGADAIYFGLVCASTPLVEAYTKPIDTDRLQEQFGRLVNTPFSLEKLTNHLSTSLMLPVSELNRMRREIVVQLEELRSHYGSVNVIRSYNQQGLVPS
jgi:hypothetical protein